MKETYAGVIKRQALRISRTAEKIEKELRKEEFDKETYEDLLDDLNIYIKQLEDSYKKSQVAGGKDE